MARDWIEQTFNRGLNWVRPKGALSRGQSYVAENVEFTKSTVRRRLGIEDAYGLDLNELARVPSLISRFYKLNADGTVSPKFFKVIGAQSGGTPPDSHGLWVADSDFDDDTGTMVDSWTNIPAPAGVGWIDGFMKDYFQSKEWCYLIPENQSSDSTSDTTNIPIRTDGTSSFKMGLEPPIQIDYSDISGDDEGPKSIVWKPHFDTTFGSESQSDFVLNSDGTKGYMAYAGASSFLNLATLDMDSLTWSTEVVDSNAVRAVANQNSRQIAIALDSYDSPSIAWDKNAATPQYSYLDRSSGTWTTETISSTGMAAGRVALFIDSEDVVHVVSCDGFPSSTAEMFYTRKDGDTWMTAAEEPDGGSSTTSAIPSIYVDDELEVHLAYTYNPGAGNTLIAYRKRTAGAGGSWGSRETVYDTGGVADAGGADVVVGPTGTIHVSFYDVDTDFDLYYSAKEEGGSWSAAAVFLDWATGTSSPNFHTRIRLMNQKGWASESIFIIGLKDRGVAPANFAPAIAFRPSGQSSWESAYVSEQHSATRNVSLFIDGYTVYAAFGDVNESGVVIGAPSSYHYRLTAEYDDGILGESGPSDPVVIFAKTEIGLGKRVGIDLSGGTTYDMTADVTKIHIYRTARDEGEDGIYYRVGSVDAVAGVVQDSFTDDISDAVLTTTRQVMDSDVFMPPKFRTGVIWRDRAVIADLKARDTSADEDAELDLEGNGFHRNRIRFSKAFQPDIYPALHFIDILPDGSSGRIQKLVVNSEEDQLYVFLENDTMALVGDSVLGERGTPFRPINISRASGTPARRSVVYAKGHIFYWTKRGIEVIRNGVARDITSETIGPMWNQRDSASPAYAYRINMDNIDQVAGVYDQELQQIRWSYPSAAGTVNNRELVLHLNRWFENYRDDGVFSINSYGFTAYSTWDGEGDRSQLFGAENDAVGKSYIYRLNYGEEDRVNVVSSQTNVPITMKLSTDLEDFRRPDLIKRFKSMRLNGKSGVVDVDVVVDVDGIYTANVSNLDFSGGGIKRLSTALPRYANGVRAGVQITATHTLDTGVGPEAFELYDLAWYFDIRQTRVRNVS